MSFKHRRWRIGFDHILRDDNRCADWITNFSFTSEEFDLKIWPTPSRELSLLLASDVSGAPIPHLVTSQFFLLCWGQRQTSQFFFALLGLEPRRFTKKKIFWINGRLHLNEAHNSPIRSIVVDYTCGVVSDPSCLMIVSTTSGPNYK